MLQLQLLLTWVNVLRFWFGVFSVLALVVLSVYIRLSDLLNGGYLEAEDLDKLYIQIKLKENVK